MSWHKPKHTFCAYVLCRSKASPSLNFRQTPESRDPQTYILTSNPLILSAHTDCVIQWPGWPFLWWQIAPGLNSVGYILLFQYKAIRFGVKTYIYPKHSTLSMVLFRNSAREAACLRNSDLRFLPAALCSAVARPFIVRSLIPKTHGLTFSSKIYLQMCSKTRLSLAIVKYLLYSVYSMQIIYWEYKAVGQIGDTGHAMVRETYFHIGWEFF